MPTYSMEQHQRQRLEREQRTAGMAREQSDRTREARRFTIATLQGLGATPPVAERAAELLETNATLRRMRASIATWGAAATQAITMAKGGQ